MDFFSKTLTAKDYQNLDKKGCIPVVDRKLDSVLKMHNKYWIVGFRYDNHYIAYITPNPHGLFRFIFYASKQDGAFKNVSGDFTSETIDEGHNKTISDLMEQSNVILQMQKKLPLKIDKEMLSMSTPHGFISTKEEYDNFLKEEFTNFDKAQSLEELRDYKEED